MRSTLKTAIVLALLTTIALAPTVAKAEGTAGSRIAIIDVAFIFKTHAGIKAQVSAVEDNLKRYDEELKAKRAELQQAATKLKTFQAGTPEYTAQEEMVAGMESKLRLDMNRKRKELADAEAKIYFENYKLISDAVADVAKHYKIDLVLRFNSEDMDLNKGDSVVRGVMKNIVYHSPTMDMTQSIMTILDQRIAAGASAARR